MSTPLPTPPHTPLIALVDRLGQVLQRDMVTSGRDAGYPELKYSHNAVFGFLGTHGSHASDLAARSGMTRQSMGEVVRDLTALGIVETTVDPDDRRAKLVTYTDYGLGVARAGRQHIVDLEERLAAELGAEEYAVLRAALVRIAELVAPAE